MSQNATRPLVSMSGATVPSTAIVFEHTWDDLADVHLASRQSATGSPTSSEERDELALMVDAQAAMSWNVHAQLFC